MLRDDSWQMLGVYDPSELMGMLPLSGVGKPLGVDVGDLVAGVAVVEIIPVFCETFGEPRHADPMSAPYVPHSRIPTGLAHSYHGLIVLLKLQILPRLAQHVHELGCWDAFSPETESTGNNLSLWRRVRHGSLLFANANDRELRSDTRDVEMHTRGAAAQASQRVAVFGT